MIRGTTAQFKFTMPYNFSDVAIANITFWQNEYYGPDKTRPLPIIKILEQCSQGSSSKELVVTLNKEETLRFTDERRAYVQMLAETIDGMAFGSNTTMITVYPVHNDNILDDDILPTPGPGDNGIVILDGSTIV